MRAFGCASATSARISRPKACGIGFELAASASASFSAAGARPVRASKRAGGGRRVGFGAGDGRLGLARGGRQIALLQVPSASASRFTAAAVVLPAATSTAMPASSSGRGVLEAALYGARSARPDRRQTTRRPATAPQLLVGLARVVRAAERQLRQRAGDEGLERAGFNFITSSLSVIASSNWPAYMA